jgi:hypothetical protein
MARSALISSVASPCAELVEGELRVTHLIGLKFEFRISDSGKRRMQTPVLEETKWHQEKGLMMLIFSPMVHFLIRRLCLCS